MTCSPASPDLDLLIGVGAGPWGKAVAGVARVEVPIELDRLI